MHGGNHRYWLEFGTAGRQDPTPPTPIEGVKSTMQTPHTDHAGTYPIDPVNAKALRFETEGGIRFAMHVDHPGIRPRLIYRSVRGEIISFAMDVVAACLEENISVASLRAGLVEEIMPYAIHRMGEQLNLQAPGVKEVTPFQGYKPGTTSKL